MLISQLVEKHNYLDNPVFIVGSGRCGTTLMHSLLDGHPQLLVWPFEYSYFTFFRDFQQIYHVSTTRVSKLFEYFYKTDVGYFGKRYPGGRRKKGFSLEAVNAETFRSVVDTYKNEVPTRRQFLQLLMYAYHQAFCPWMKPKAFVLQINIPRDGFLDDFPQARVIYMARNPLHTYASIKRYYCKASGSKGYCYGAADRRFERGLVELALTQVLYAYTWLQRHKNLPGLMRVKLEELQNDTEKVIGEVADFVQISSESILLEATRLGQSYGSNLSSGKDSEGKVVADNYHLSKQYLQELTPYELEWVYGLLKEVVMENGYKVEIPFDTLSKMQKMLNFLKPMINEFPSFCEEKNNTKFTIKSLIRPVYLWVLACINYTRNRIFFLRYPQEKRIDSYPYKCLRSG